MKTRHLLFAIIVTAFAVAVSFYPLNYYIMQPGSAYDAHEYIEVDQGDDDEGEFNFMTVSIGKATPITYLIAKYSDYKDILKREEVRQANETDEEYNLRQLKLMSDSQFNALYVAFSRAKLPYEIERKGVYIVQVVEQSAADGIIKPADIVTKVDGKQIQKLDDLRNELAGKKEGDLVKVSILRKNEEIQTSVTLKEIPGTDGQIGIGISYSESKKITTNPTVKTDTEDIGGPSAGLMFTLEILNQLLPEDLTKGYKVAGTGEMNEDGTVGRIGGIDKKVVAADRAGMEIFFAPADVITEEMLKKAPEIRSNYDVALQTAKEIGTTMKIVPVKTIDEALAYLEKLPQK